MAAVLSTVLAGVVACSANPAMDFCTGYGDAMHALVVAAREYESRPEHFTAVYQSTVDELRQVRATAPDTRLRSAFDTAWFTFSVFTGSDARFADFLTRADFSGNAVVIACAEYGVDVRV